MAKVKEAADLVRKSQDHAPLLTAQAQPFRPPPSPIRLTTVIDLGSPLAPISRKCVLLAPVSGLSLDSPDAVHRFKLLAGPRWTPGRPGRKETEFEGNDGYNAGKSNIGREGWVKISEDRFSEPKMNRKSASDMLERLVAAANDKKSPISADLPLDTRHILARQRKKSSRMGGGSLIRYEAMKLRPHHVGGVQGFPIEWLAKEQ